MRLTNYIPKDKCFDNTLRLLLEGYNFIPNRCHKLKSDLFITRLMGRKVICMSGKNAATLFYDRMLFTRKGAIPRRIRKTLFGEKGIQTLCGPQHLHRKKMFAGFMTPASINRLAEIFRSEWQRSARRWLDADRICLFDEAALMLCRAACRWTHVPLKRCEAWQRSRDFSAMVDAFGAVGPRHWKGRCARKRTERWITGIIHKVRRGRLDIPQNSILHQIAFHTGLDGRLLDAKTAAVEIINILRPITAIATYITFGAHAMKIHPECREKIQKKDGTYTEMFVQEVRRYYPFGPFLGARVRNYFIYKNYLFKRGTLVFLDIYGTNHDPRIWKKPWHFIPERFRKRDISPYDFIPQGGGDMLKGTRCPGEQIAIELMRISMDYLANRLEYTVPVQKLKISLRRIPTLPKSRFIMEGIKRKD